MEKTESEYLESIIKKLIKSIEYEHFQYIMGEQTHDGYQEEYPGWIKTWIRLRLEDLYYLILAYIEGKGMAKLLSAFIEKFKEDVFDNTKNLNVEFVHPEDEGELAILIGYKQFLSVFPKFDNSNILESEEKKVISILKNTDHILKKTNTKIKGEADIYNQIKWILSLYYPTVKYKNKARFFQEFKDYSPDILIPELKMAIEYKYIRVNDNQSKIEDHIDQIRTDATNYVGDPRYDTFLAVIYLEDSAIATHDSIEISWHAKKFPENWKLITSINNNIISS